MSNNKEFLHADYPDSTSFAGSLEEYLSNDVITAGCKIWFSDKKSDSLKTFISIVSFQCVIPNISRSKKGEIACRNLFINPFCSEISILNDEFGLHGKKRDLCFKLYISSSDENINCCFNSAVVNKEGELFYPIERERTFRQKSHPQLWLLTKNLNLNEVRKSSDVLLDDNLTFTCDLSFSCSKPHTTNSVDSALDLLPLIGAEDENSTRLKNKGPKIVEKPLGSLTLKESLENLYEQRFLIDFNFCSAKKTFPVHSTILACRSPAFKLNFEMFSDVKTFETDLDSEAVDDIFRFLYTDIFDKSNFNTEKALKLYDAASYFELVPVKNCCKEHFMKNMNVSNVCRILEIVHNHIDDQILSAVFDFFFENEQEILGLQEWNSLIEKNPSIVAKTMTYICLMRPMNKAAKENFLRSIFHRQESEEDKERSLLEDFRRLHQERYLSDLNIVVGTTKIPVHSAILGCRSSVFKCMLESNMLEKKTKCIEINDIDVEVVKLLVQYLYTDEVGTLNSDLAMQLYFAADKYELILLRDKCAEFMKRSLNVSKVCEILELADRHFDVDLSLSAQDFFAKFESQVLSSDGWKHILKRNPLLAAETLTSIRVNNRGKVGGRGRGRGRGRPFSRRFATRRPGYTCDY